MKTSTTTKVVLSVFFSAIFTSAFFVGCGGNKEEVKQDSIAVIDTIKLDSLGLDTIKVDTIAE